jgi:hypothetical protein
MDLAKRRTTAETRIAALEQARGIALLDGKSFDARELTALETELDAINAAEGEAARRVRAAVEAAGQARIDALKEKLERRNTDRLEAVERAEQAARDLCEAAKLWIAANEDCGDLIRSLKQSGGGGILNANETESRLGFMLACALKPLFGMRRKLGMVTFPDSLPRFAGNWREAEQTITEPEILAALKGAEK